MSWTIGLATLIESKMADIAARSAAPASINIFVRMPCANYSSSIRRDVHDNHKILFSLTLFEHWLRTHEEPVASVS